MTQVATAPATRRRTLSPAVLLALICVGAVAVLVLALVGSPRTAFGAGSIAHTSGLLAGYGIAIMLLLMARSPMIEYGVGADRLARWHARAGPMIILAVVVHVVAAVLSWMTTRQSSMSAAAAEMLAWPGLVPATVGTGLLILVGVVSIRWLRRRIAHEHWHLVHLLTYLGAALAFSHQLAGPDLVGHRVVQIGWSLLYAYAFATVLRYRVVQPLHQLIRHRLRVERVIRESDDVISVVTSGQHQLRITVKALGGGTQSLSALRPGATVLAEGPYGAITGRRRRRPRVLLIAGGVGITPMRTLFETIDLPGSDLTLIYRASSEDRLVLRAELDEIAATRGARLIYLVGPSTAPANQLTARSLERLVGDLADHDIYLCAPARMSAGIRESLLRAGHPRRQLHQEHFSF